jgi:HD-like signal output (HDOD) protein
MANEENSGTYPEWYTAQEEIQYPAPVDELKEPPFTIDNNLREKLRAKLKTFIPSPPASFQMYQKLSDPNTTPGEYAQIASQDPFFVARILKTVNSAIFGLKNPITEVGRAVVFLGFQNIKSLALAHCMQSKEIMKDVDMEALKKLWVHSAVVSALSTSFSKHHTGINAFEMGTIGLLHDLGRILVDSSPMKKNLDKLPEQLPLSVIESLCGSIFAESWGLPESIIQTIEYSAYPGIYHVDNIPEKVRKQACILYASNLLANLYGFKDEGEWHGLSDEVLLEIHLTNTPETWLTPEMTQEVDQAINMFMYL